VSGAAIAGVTAGPADLSPAAVTGLLRHQLGFTGLIVTDVLNAGSIVATGADEPTAAAQAVEAGADLVLLGSLTDVNAVVARLEAEVNAGRLPVAELNAAVDQVMQHKPVNPCRAVAIVGAGGDGYAIVDNDGTVEGNVSGAVPGAPIVGGAATPDGRGWWVVAGDGQVTALGDAPFEGAASHARPIVGMSATPDGRGYWLVASDGGVYTFGDAPFLGAASHARPIVGMSATSDGRGYWLVASDGGVYTFGDAPFFGSPPPQNDVVGIRATPDGRGYRLLRADETVLRFGDAGP
jgi:hypothetical protein